MRCADMGGSKCSFSTEYLINVMLLRTSVICSYFFRRKKKHGIFDLSNTVHGFGFLKILSHASGKVKSHVAPLTVLSLPKKTPPKHCCHLFLFHYCVCLFVELKTSTQSG